MALRRCILIPMRGGSKGVPRKNMVPFEGKPLCHHVLQAAVDSIIPCKDIWVSTEDAEIREAALQFGVNVHNRLPEHARDESSDLEVFRHFVDVVVDAYSEHHYDYVIHLRATFPRITPQIIEDAVGHFEKNYDCCSSLRSVVKAQEVPWKMWTPIEMGTCDLLTPVVGVPSAGNHSAPRQLLPQAYYQNAAIDIVKCSTIRRSFGSMTGDRPIAFYMDGMVEDGVDVDDPEDLR